MDDHIRDAIADIERRMERYRADLSAAISVWMETEHDVFDLVLRMPEEALDLLGPHWVPGV